MDDNREVEASSDESLTQKHEDIPPGKRESVTQGQPKTVFAAKRNQRLEYFKAEARLRGKAIPTGQPKKYQPEVKLPERPDLANQPPVNINAEQQKKATTKHPAEDFYRDNFSKTEEPAANGCGPPSRVRWLPVKIALVLIAISVLFPPWFLANKDGTARRYALILSPPTADDFDDKGHVYMDTSRLFAEWVGILAVTALFAVRWPDMCPKRDPPSSSSGNVPEGKEVSDVPSSEPPIATPSQEGTTALPNHPEQPLVRSDLPDSGESRDQVLAWALIVAIAAGLLTIVVTAVIIEREAGRGQKKSHGGVAMDASVREILNSLPPMSQPSSGLSIADEILEEEFPEQAAQRKARETGSEQDPRWQRAVAKLNEERSSASQPANSLPDDALRFAPNQKTILPSGTKREDVVVGTGAEARVGNTVFVHYTGTLLDGTKFDSSRDRGEPLPFRLGAGEVIKGWDQGIAGMKVGGKRKLTIPPDQAYGERSPSSRIPPGSTLLFDVELMDVKQSGPALR